jgi:hypothetical protein
VGCSRDRLKNDISMPSCLCARALARHHDAANGICVGSSRLVNPGLDFFDLSSVAELRNEDFPVFRDDKASRRTLWHVVGSQITEPDSWSGNCHCIRKAQSRECHRVHCGSVISGHGLYGSGGHVWEGQVLGHGAGIDRFFDPDRFGSVPVRGNDRSPFESFVD